MELDSVLAKFTAPGPIESRAELDVALEELLAILAASRDDIPSLLDIVASGTQGLLEAILTSSGRDAFAFRRRIAKVLQKSLGTSTPVFRTCADRLGAFLISIPPHIALDRSVMEDFNAFTTATTDADSIVSEHLANRSSVGPTSPTKPGRRESRNTRSNSANLVSSTKATSQSVFTAKSSSSISMTSPSNLPKLLTRFLENFLSICISPEIEKFAIDNLFAALTPENPAISSGVISANSVPPAPAAPIITTSPTHAPLKPESLSQLQHLSLKQEDIIKYLNHASKPNSKDWPVVVSQRGIKRLRQYVVDKEDLFLRIEKRIRQLSVGFFPSQNQTKLLPRDSGIPIYIADLGDGLRLIYHIDFGAPTATGQESQFIRVFGVFHESEVDVKFWGSVAAQLARRGQEYIDRCTDRGETRIRFKGVETIPPKLFPSLDVSQWNKDGADIEVDESHFLELHRVLALEKFVPLSKNFFEAIRKFDEYSFMFAVSSSEYRIITHPSSCLVLGRSGTGKTTCMLFRMAVLDMDTKKLPRPARQMFVTQSGTLAKNVRKQWEKLLQKDQNGAVGSPETPNPSPSVPDSDDSDDDGAEDTGVLPPNSKPRKFSELKDSHFPLFLTYNKLCKLLEADYGLQFIRSTNKTAFDEFRGAREQRPIRQPLVSFKYFEANIWPRLDEGLKRGLHPILVYSEFVGVIKGSEASKSYPKRFLSRQAYELQSSRTQFGDPTERSRIYTLFEAYLKLRPPSSYDLADRVHSLLVEVEKRGIPGDPVDFLYVDEAQDHLITDAALLRAVCPNPDGLFFAGDTAQTISAGSTFRFSELKAFLYRLERDDELVKRGTRKPVDPQFFQLSTNYRTHSGIVKSAAFLVRLITSYFGHCIDSLRPEASLVDISAHKPVFFLGRENQDDFLRLISRKDNGEVGLGAHQVIIVRDKPAAQKLREAGVNALPLYESKGMEFDDVILYDFFNDSLATATDWRAILHSECRGKPFDEKRHAILRTELKALYVGLTRARERVWIWDRSYKGADLETLLATLELATVHDITGAVPQLGVSSSSHEWSERAQQYFSKGCFLDSALAFKKAGMEWWESVATAYHDRQATVRLPQQHHLFQSSFNRVAQEFVRLAEIPEGVHNPATSRRLYLNAGECYAVISNHAASASAFLKGKKYTEAAYYFKMAGSFEEAIDVINRYPVDAEVAESITYTAKIVYTKRRNVASVRKAADLFESRDDFLEFLEDHGFDEQRIVFLESLKEYERVGDIHRAAEDFISAVLQFRRANTVSSRRKAIDCLLEGLRANISFGVGYGKRSEQLSQLFKLSQVIELSQDERNEIDLLRAVSELDSARLREHGLRCLKSGKTVHALLAFDSWTFSDASKVFSSASDIEAAEILTTSLSFGTVVNTVARTRKILDNPAARELFCMATSKPTSRSHSGMVSIKRQSFVYNSPNLTAHSRKGTSKAPASHPRDAVEDEIRRCLWVRLNGFINRIESFAQESRAYELCIPFVATGKCADMTQGLCWRDHPSDDELTVSKFNSRFRLHILTIALLDKPNYEQWDEHKIVRVAKQRAWLHRLFQLCYPPTNKPGNLSDVVPSLIPEYKEAMKVVSSCLFTVFKGLRPSNGPEDFLNNVLRTSLLATAFDYTSAKSYLKRGQWMLDTQLATQHALVDPATNRPLVGAALPWFVQDTPTRTDLGVYFLERAIGGDVWFDIDVAIAFVEEVCAQLILNQEAHRFGGRHCLIMPRSWIIRALSRGESLRPNEAAPSHLVSLLEKFIGILLLRERKDDCRLQVKGAPLKDSRSHMSRYLGLVRLSRCLSLVGHNIPHLRKKVLSILNQMGNSCSDIQLYSGCPTWAAVVDALKSTSSCLDELTFVSWKEDTISNEYGIRAILCSDHRTLLRDLSLGLLATAPDSSATSAQEQPANQSVLITPVPEVEEQQILEANTDTLVPDTSLDTFVPEITDDTEHQQTSAKTIQRFFRRHQNHADGSLITAFEEVVNQLVRTTPESPCSRFFLLCLRGPLPHVVEFLEKFKDMVHHEVSVLGKKIVNRKDENFDEGSSKELRRIRNNAKKLLKDLRPPSDFYSKGKSNSPVSVTDIVEKVKEIHMLVQSLRPFMEIPEDVRVDYELGVEPLVSDRVPWAQPEATAGMPSPR